ncbi:MAG: DUF4139 domain-containing protein, partial [Planctomycetota bacterium]
MLNADALRAMWELALEQREQLAERSLRIETERVSIEEQIAQRSRERSQLTAGTPRSRYRARVFVDMDAQRGGTLRLRYSVGGCRWSPQYAINGRSAQSAIELRYGAVIEQLSGESWDNVRLTLSTASPSVSASGPMLTPLRIAAVTPDQAGEFELAEEMLMDEISINSYGMGMDMEMSADATNRGALAMPSQRAQASAFKGMVQAIRGQQRTAETSAAGQGNAGQQQRDLTLNRLAGQMQELELRASAKATLGAQDSTTDEVASQTYLIAQPVSLPSRREQQLVEIVDATLAAEWFHTATPLLSSFAYREAEAINDLDMGLLSGPVSVYLDDRFVGTMNLPTIAAGQRLTIGLGADGQVRTRRELTSKEEMVQGGNRRLAFDYKLVINNFKTTPIQVRLLDRMPIPDQSQQTRVQRTIATPGLSDDPLYVRMQMPHGILRWDLDIDAARHGSDAVDIQYSYSVEFDRNRVLSVPQNVDELFGAISYPSGIGGGGIGGGGIGGGGIGGGGIGGGGIGGGGIGGGGIGG